MKEKLQALMDREGIKPSLLAERLGINPAGISHILAGRNKPSFDLLQKILRTFPDVNPDWLLLDSDVMYRHELSRSAPASATPQQPKTQSALFDGLFGQTIQSSTPQKISGQNDSIDNIPEDRKIPEKDFSSNYENMIERKSNTSIERVVIFYADRTFESFTPTK